jgi:formylglycine-generating enzyme required for sulfatase activity
MGASRREPGRRANETLRPVELVRPFYVGLREVTNQEFRLFKADHSSGLLGRATLDGDAQPVVNVTGEQAAEYCNWLSARESLPAVYRRDGSRMAVFAPLSNGYRLPTEAEWELVARRAAGGVLLKYPWGAALPVALNSGNYADASAKALLPGILPTTRTVIPSALRGFLSSECPWPFRPRGQRGRMGPRPLLDPPVSNEPARDPTGPAEGVQHVIRGSSFMHASVTELRLSFRDYGEKPRPDLGFRVARDAE